MATRDNPNPSKGVAQQLRADTSGKSKLDDIPTVWISTGLWGIESKFIVVELKSGADSKTILRVGKSHYEPAHIDVFYGLCSEKAREGIVVDENNVKGGGRISIDFHKKEITVLCDSYKFGAAETDQVKDLLIEGLRGRNIGNLTETYSGYKILEKEGEKLLGIIP